MTSADGDHTDIIALELPNTLQSLTVMFEQNEIDIQMMHFIDSCSSKNTYLSSTTTLKIFLIVLRNVFSRIIYRI